MLKIHLRKLAGAVLLSAALLPLLAGTANAATTSPIDTRYNTDHALAALLGTPKSSEYSVAGGRERDYAGGSLYWTKATGVHEVHGGILARYKNLGGPAGRLGFPTTDENHVYIKVDVPAQQVGARNNFQNGALIWAKSDGHTAWISKPFADFLPLNETYPYYGIPVGDERPVVHGYLVDLGDSRIYLTTTGIHFLSAGYPSGSDEIVGKYISLDADAGLLGVPNANEVAIAATKKHEVGRMQSFDTGVIYQRGGSTSGIQAYEVHGDILLRFQYSGGLQILGFPVTNEQDTSGGRISYFEHGSIFWSSATHATTVKLS